MEKTVMNEENATEKSAESATRSETAKDAKSDKADKKKLKKMENIFIFMKKLHLFGQDMIILIML